jgi:uncharacterized membrane protein YciS (DUF1049 family)
VGDSLVSLLLGAGSLFFVLAWVITVFLAIGWPIMAVLALRHLKSIRISLEQIARTAERADLLADNPTKWDRPTRVG